MADEYIRRDAALRAVTKRYGACRSPAQNRLLDEIRNEIRRAPAADVAPVVHAHRVDTGGMYGDCSNCRYTLPFGVNYCSECGAKIDGGAEK